MNRLQFKSTWKDYQRIHLGIEYNHDLPVTLSIGLIFWEVWVWKRTK